MLRISKITDYGTLVLTHMASMPEHLFSASDLAATLGLGVPTVSKVLKLLGHHDLVLSVRGLHGGYRLGRPPEQISVAEIVDALEDKPFGLTECSASSGVCSIETSCRIRANWQRINVVVRGALEDVTLAEMVRPVPIECVIKPRTNDAELPTRPRRQK